MTIVLCGMRVLESDIHYTYTNFNSRDEACKKQLFLRDFLYLTRKISCLNKETVNETLNFLKKIHLFLYT